MVKNDCAPIAVVSASSIHNITTLKQFGKQVVKFCFSDSLLISVKFTFGVPFDGFVFKIFTFVMQFFTFGQGEFDFDFSPRKIGFGRNQGQAFYCHLADQPFDFMFMEQEFSRAHGFVIMDVAM